MLGRLLSSAESEWLLFLCESYLVDECVSDASAVGVSFEVLLLNGETASIHVRWKDFMRGAIGLFAVK